MFSVRATGYVVLKNHGNICSLFLASLCKILYTLQHHLDKYLMSHLQVVQRLPMSIFLVTGAR